MHYETPTAHARVVADVTGKSLLPAIEEMMDTKRTHLHTDGHSRYRNIASQFARHEFSWLYTHCKSTDSERMRTLLGNVQGRRLTYKPLVAKVDF